MLLDGINILVQYLENTIKVVPHNLKVPNIFQVITSRNKKVFHSVVHIFTKSSGKTCLEFRLVLNLDSQKDVKPRKRKKIMTRVAFELVAMGSLSSWLLLKHQTP